MKNINNNKNTSDINIDNYGGSSGGNSLNFFDYYNFSGFAPQGWQCPICGRVYSPSTPMCYYCSRKTEITTTTSTAIPQPDTKNNK